MKKLFALLLVLVLALSLCACAAKNANNVSNQSNNNAAVNTPANNTPANNTPANNTPAVVDTPAVTTPAVRTEVSTVVGTWPLTYLSEGDDDRLDATSTGWSLTLRDDMTGTLYMDDPHSLTWEYFDTEDNMYSYYITMDGATIAMVYHVEGKFLVMSIGDYYLWFNR